MSNGLDSGEQNRYNMIDVLQIWAMKLLRYEHEQNSRA